MRKIVKRVSTIEDFNKELFERLDIGVEIQDYTEPNLSLEDFTSTMLKYKLLLEDFKGIKSLHGPFLDLKPASPDKEIQRVSQTRYIKTLNVARELNVDYLIFHSQISPFLDYPPMEKLNNEQAKDMWEKIIPLGGYKNKIVIENIFERSPRMLKSYIEKMDNKQIRINLDIGHAKLADVDLETWIRELKDYIEYMHIHTNDGIYDTHNIPTREEINKLYFLLDKYKINPIICLEYDVEDLEEEIKKYR